jgi:hypothetical protein
MTSARHTSSCAGIDTIKALGIFTQRFAFERSVASMTPFCDQNTASTLPPAESGKEAIRV